MVLLCGHIDRGTPATEFPAKDLNEFMTAEKHATNHTTHELLLVMVYKLGQLKTQENKTFQKLTNGQCRTNFRDKLRNLFNIS